jgi:hypothetical protein
MVVTLSSKISVPISCVTQPCKEENEEVENSDITIPSAWEWE